MTAKMEKLCQDREDAMRILNSLDPMNDGAKVDEYLAKVKDIDKAINNQETIENLAKESAQDVKAAPVQDNAKFKSFGEQLIAIKNAAISRGRNVDRRLVKDDIKGVSTTVDADGGYAVQEDFLGNILDRAFERSPIINACRSYTVTANSNRVNYVTVDDAEDASDSANVKVAGGVQAYWTKEGQTVTPTKPKFKTTELKLSKIMGLCYVTEEALEDMSFIGPFVEDSFSDAVAGLLTQGILTGDGTVLDQSKPMGLFSEESQAVVKLTPTDKTGKTIKPQDILNMRAAIRTKDWGNAVWYMHPDLAPQLPLLNDGAGNLLYMPQGGLSGAQYGTLLGRPIVFDEFMSQADKTGSILLANMDEYLLIRKGTERHDWSAHVEFLTDQWCFRIVLRVNGAPMFNNVWSVRNSENKRGSFVTLDFDSE